MLSEVELREIDAEIAHVPYRQAVAGDTFLAVGPSAGGYGSAFERDPDAVLDDVLDGIVSVESAESDYGVVIRGGAVDAAATAAKRGG